MARQLITCDNCESFEPFLCPPCTDRNIRAGLLSPEPVCGACGVKYDRFEMVEIDKGVWFDPVCAVAWEQGCGVRLRP